MKHYFILNPAAGYHSPALKLEKILNSYSGIDYEIYITKCALDAKHFTEQKSKSGESVRFYACGGDGTLNETVNGAVGFDNASVACFPCGSGNDFVKYYGQTHFQDITDLIFGEAKKIDVIKVGERFAVNACHFGLDTCVAEKMTAIKNKKIIGGKHAYPCAVIYAVLHGMRTECSIIADGERISGNEILLCTISNGRYVGGSYKCAPFSLNDDGLLELCHVKPISRLKLLKLMNIYKEGKHLDDERFRDFVTYRQVKKVQIEAPEKFKFSLDGEVVTAYNPTVEIVPGALNFVLPRTVGKAHNKMSYQSLEDKIMIEK